MADGQTRVILGSHEDETALTLSDANGKVRCKMFAEPNGESGVHVRDASGTTVWKASSEQGK